MATDRYSDRTNDARPAYPAKSSQVRAPLATSSSEERPQQHEDHQPGQSDQYVDQRRLAHHSITLCFTRLGLWSILLPPYAKIGPTLDAHRNLSWPLPWAFRLQHACRHHDCRPTT